MLQGLQTNPVPANVSIHRVALRMTRDRPYDHDTACGHVPNCGKNTANLLKSKPTQQQACQQQTCWTAQLTKDNMLRLAS